MSTNKLKLADDSIAQIAKLVQIAILTGTDVVDNLRLLELEESEGTLVPTAEFLDRVNDNVEQMLKFAEENQENDG